MRAPERLDVEALLRPRPACSPEAAPKRRIAGQALQCGGERLRIPWVDQQARLAVDDLLRDAADTRRDDREDDDDSGA